MNQDIPPSMAEADVEIISSLTTTWTELEEYSFHFLNSACQFSTKVIRGAFSFPTPEAARNLCPSLLTA